jgi:hypothetical protein
MKNWKSVILTSISVAALGALGCDEHGGGQPQDQSANNAPQAQSADQQPDSVVVESAPPPLIVEVQPPAPSPSEIWVAGYWNWDNQRYNWQAGRYMAPPQRDVVWVAPRYDADPHGNRYTPGKWSKPAQAPADNRVPDRDGHSQN